MKSKTMILSAAGGNTFLIPDLKKPTENAVGFFVL